MVKFFADLTALACKLRGKDIGLLAIKVEGPNKGAPRKPHRPRLGSSSKAARANEGHLIPPQPARPPIRTAHLQPGIFVPRFTPLFV